MKIVVNAELIKSLNKKKDAAQLNYFKKELIKVLEKNDEEIVSKAIEDYDNSIKKTYSEIGIEKAGYGIGTVRVWKGQKFRKIAPGKWRRIYDSNTRGARQSINIIKKKIANAQSIDELLQLVMENTNRFMDADGKLLPIVEELQNAVKESKGRLNTGKPSTQNQIEQFKKENGKSEEEQLQDEISGIDAAFNKIVAIDIYRNDYEKMKLVNDKAKELYGNITKKLREAEDEGDYSKVRVYELAKERLHRVLSRIQWRFDEVEKNYTKTKFFEGIENEKDFKRAEIPDSEDAAIVKFNDKISEFIKDNKNSTWAIYTNLITLMKNVTDKKAAHRWCVINGISNFNELQKEVENRIKHVLQEEQRAKNMAVKAAREEKIKKINEDNALKTYSKEEIQKAFDGVDALMAERDTLRDKIKETITKENEARIRYSNALQAHDENRHKIWDEVLEYRKQANEYAEQRDSFEKKLDAFMDPVAYYYLTDTSYEKDTSIDNCRTTKEVEDLIKSKDWYTEEGKKRLDLKLMDVRAAKDVFKCMERIFAIIPEQKGRNISMKCEPCYKNWWAFARGGEITFNSKNYKDYSEFEKECEETVGNFHPKGTTAKDITYHEYYHVMTTGRLAKRIKEKVTKRLKMRGKKGGPKQDDIIRFGVSEYATTNADEFGAECFQQALGSKNPSAFAVEVFKETLKYKKYMRGMV